MNRIRVFEEAAAQVHLHTDAIGSLTTVTDTLARRDDALQVQVVQLNDDMEDVRATVDFANEDIYEVRTESNLHNMRLASLEAHANPQHPAPAPAQVQEDWHNDIAQEFDERIGDLEDNIPPLPVQGPADDQFSLMVHGPDRYAQLPRPSTLEDLLAFRAQQDWLMYVSRSF